MLISEIIHPLHLIFVDYYTIFLTLQQNHFNSIAKEANVSKSWLYKEHDIRQRIESLRERQITSNVVSKPKKSSRSEEILIKTLKRRVMELKKENKKLQNQIQKLYGDLYNKE